jgi:hypothetical protein
MLADDDRDHQPGERGSRRRARANEVAQARAADGDLVIWPGASIETMLWFCLSDARIDEPALSALLELVSDAWHLRDAHGTAAVVTA